MKIKQNMLNGWGRNKLSLQIIKTSIGRHITGIVKFDNAKDCLDTIKRQIEAADKAIGASLMNRFSTMKYDGWKEWEHIMEMVNLASKLKNICMSVSDEYLIQFVLYFLPSFL